MEKYELQGQENCLYYVSSKCRTWEPAKSIILLAPDAVACSRSRLEAFAASSGWLEAGEADGAVVILPLAPRGWAEESVDRVKTLYKTVWRDTLSPDPRESLRNVWCWETLIFAVGYGEGAVYAGNAAVAHPNAFAQVIMVDGAPTDYSRGEQTTDRWLLPDASEGWNPKNQDVPVAVWMLGDQDATEAAAYFGRHGEDYAMVTPGTFGPEPKTTALLLGQMNTRIRWKNSPDGTPARLKPKARMDTDGEYTLDRVTSNGVEYEYYTRLPAGTVSGKGLPVVISMHGHGEPAWMFVQKNGWPELQDETGEFVLVSPDSPEHTWLIERDEGMHEKMLDKLEKDYGIDRTRVYLSGFSNGSMATCWYGTRHPQLYAALSPWNSPLVAFEETLIQDGWEMPMFAINGDLDHKMDPPRRSYEKLFKNWITLNGGKPRPAQIPKPWAWKYDIQWNSENVYTKENGYTQGDRLTTYVYQNLEGQDRFCFTVARDMPHGAIADEARASWRFLKRFSRPAGSKRVIDSEKPDFAPMLERRTLPSGYSVLGYVAPACNSYTPARTLILIPAAENARDEAAALSWMEQSGWIRQANKDGSVLLVPISGGSWADKPLSLVKETYRAYWAKTPSREPGNRVVPREKPGSAPKQGNAWTWEVLWNIVGYGDGAAFAGAAAAYYPNRFASVTLLGGAPETFPDGAVKSDHFLVSREEGKNPALMLGVSLDYDVRVVNLPSAVWMHLPQAEAGEKAAAYFRSANAVTDEAGEDVTIGGYTGKRWHNPMEEAQQILLTQGSDIPAPQQLMDLWIGSAIRWKNGPDGTLKRFWWEDEILAGKSPYVTQSFRYPTETRDRKYYVYQPKNLPPKAPVVITIHGHGEPAWMFISKNGWPQLADKEGILVVSPQDNSENRWAGTDDTESFLYLVQDILYKYDVDPARIYISGFSNGNFQCYSAACAHPELFAGMWPMSNCACNSRMFQSAGAGDLAKLRSHGLEMPLFGVTGDNDGWIAEDPGDPASDLATTVATFLDLAGIEKKKARKPDPLCYTPDECRGAKWYADQFGFREADRFHTWVYHNAQGQPRICLTVMKNMPHGSIWEESIAAWDFLKHFSRNSDGTITYR